VDMWWNLSGMGTYLRIYGFETGYPDHIDTVL
jgi:hypothetical protein